MGTPEFAVASLEKILHAGYNVVAIITAADKPAGRGLRLKESPIKQFAVSKGLKVLQPKKLKNPAFVKELENLKADLQIVVAFRMLPEAVWNMPPMGTINLHASLLPQYRGAAPINWAIINGEKETGLTTFKLQHAIDTGNILLQKKIKIGDTETAGELHDRMKEAGAGLLLETIDQLVENKLQEVPQSNISGFFGDHDHLFHAPKISTETCEITWACPAKKIYDLIRGLSPYPAAFTFVKGKKLKIFIAEKEMTEPKEQAGELVSDYKSYLKFACFDGYISVKEVQLEGKRKIHVDDFLRGWRH